MLLNLVYGITILFTAVVSIFSAILDLGVNLGGFTDIFSKFVKNI